jgi:peptidoglycan/xylan/chitin deacetylase (PgdA/CDA1 family)
VSLIVASAAGAMMAGFSARWNWWRKVKPGLPILMYHKVGTPPEGSQLKKLWVSPEKFRRQLGYLSDQKYHPITFKDLYNHWDTGLPLPSNPIVITFDDGYLNNYTEAFPILKDFGYRAVIYVETETIGGDNKWHDPKSETRIPMLNWDQVRELQRAGWEIGSHTMNHAKLLQIDDAQVKEEMVKSRAILAEKLGEAPPSFAYPYGGGADEPRIQNHAREAGYRTAVSVHSGKWTVEEIRQNPFVLPRAFVRGDEVMLDFHLQVTRGRSRF